MSQSSKRRSGARVAMFALLAFVWVTTTAGCASECKRLRAKYHAVVAAEKPFVKTTDAKADMPLQFGVAMRDRVLDDIVDRALAAKLDDALDFADSVALASGKKIAIQTRGKLVDIELHADGSCPSCLRVEGRLDGTIRAKLPVLPAQTVPLDGTVTLVAPVVFARTEGGGGALKLDLAQVARIGKSRIDPRLTRLPATWAKVLERPLARMVLQAVTSDLNPITLMKYGGPDLGIDGLEVLPAKLVTDAKTRVIFAGFTSNLAADTGAGLSPRTKLPADRDVAFAVHPSVAVPALIAMLRAGKLARRYDAHGKADPSGPVRVTIDSLAVAPREGDGGYPFSMGFELWNLPESGKCYRANVAATGTVGVQKTTARVDVEDVELRDSTLPGVVIALANWANSHVVEAGQKTIEKSLDRRAFAFPGGAVSLRAADVDVAPDAIWMTGRVKVGDRDAK